MVRGDYAGALRAYRGVGEIGDLEPGLLPRCLSREAAHSDAVGGAVSVQVARLLRECERRVRAGSTAGYERGRHVPLGVDAVLAERKTAKTSASFSPAQLAVIGRSHKPAAATRSPFQTSRLRRSSVWRYVVSVSTADGVVRRAVGDLPPVVRDNWGMEWRFPRSASNAGCGQLWVHPHTALGSAGTLCTVASFVLREGSGMFRKVMEAAPDGAMSDELRSALPVWVASDAVRAKAKTLFRLRQSLAHRQQLQPLSYTFDVEGCVLVFWEFCPSGTLRDVVRRYSFLSRVTTRRFAHSILSSIDELHARGLAHGFLSLDAVKVGADGVCRLCSGTTDFKGDCEVFLLSRTCYVSPQMAAGSPPTAACDMFCYGLLLVEMLSRGPAWAWAAGPEGSAPHGTPEELVALMAEGGQAFSAAVVDRRVVPAVSVLSSRQPQLHFSDDFLPLLRSLLSYEASARPTATEACDAVGQTSVG